MEGQHSKSHGQLVGGGHPLITTAVPQEDLELGRPHQAVASAALGIQAPAGAHVPRRSLLWRVRRWLQGGYLAHYRGIKAIQDPRWTRFQTNKHIDCLDDFSPGPARLAFILHGDMASGIFRRFDWLSSYRLVEMQRHLSSLEEQLKQRCLRQHQGLEQSVPYEQDDLLKSVRAAFADYATLAGAKQQFLSYRDPDSNAYNSLLHVFCYSPSTVLGIDPEPFFKEDDLMVLDPRPRKTLLAKALDDLLTILPLWVFRLLPMTDRVDSERFPRVKKNISYSCLVKFSSTISNLLALIFILVPVGLLYFYEEWTKWQKFGAITGWSLGFLVYMWACTHVSRHEAVGAAASYCALLVVFLGLS